MGVGDRAVAVDDQRAVAGPDVITIEVRSRALSGSVSLPARLMTTLAPSLTEAESGFAVGASFWGVTVRLTAATFEVAPEASWIV